MALLELASVSKSFSPVKPAVDNISLSISSGEILCLLGPSGCGKTTLLRLIAGLETADEGKVVFDGRDMGRVAPHLRDFGMMFQDFALFPHKSVAENIAFGLQMHGQSGEEIRRRVAQMLELVALPGFGERDVSQLSGGEQQRVALARSLAPEPRLLLLDEPLGALDRALRERLMLEVRHILKQVGVTAVYVTHDQTEAFAVGDRVALMNRGRIEQVDTPQNVYCRPATLFAAQFLGFRNLFDGTVLGPNEMETELGRLATVDTMRPPGARATLLIRPDAAQVMEQASDGQTNVLQARVVDTSFRGKVTQVWLESEGKELLFEFSDAFPPIGSSATLRIDPEATNVLPA